MIDHITFSKPYPARSLQRAHCSPIPAVKCYSLYQPTRRSVEIPGGTVEANESPQQACKREVREELGIDIPIGQLLRLNYREETEDLSELLLFLLDGIVLNADQIASVKLPPDELSNFHFLTLKEAKDKLIPSLYQLIESGLAQRKLNQTQYSENSITA